MTNRDYDRLAQAIQARPARHERLIVAIDGRCGSGKTTLAARLQQELGCTVFHMDDFFPRPEQRTEERLSRPGENVDHERFLAEVLLPLQHMQPVTYRPYLCARQQLGDPVTVTPSRLTIVEGSYALRSAGVSVGGAGGAAAAHRKAQRPGEGRHVPRPLDPP